MFMGILMKHYGNIDLNNNLMQQMVFETELNFPTTPVPGRLVFTNKRVYICAEISAGFPVWIPMTNELDTFVYVQAVASSSWTLVHNLNTVNPLIQVYGTDLAAVIPDSITTVDNNTSVVTFGYPIAGRAVAMFGSNLVGSTKTLASYVYTQTTLSDTWVINHDLGYYPIVRVFISDTNGNNSEIQPLSIVHNSIFQTTITFSTPYVGVARLV
jgi:hypothetical protein